MGQNTGRLPWRLSFDSLESLLRANFKCNVAEHHGRHVRLPAGLERETHILSVQRILTRPVCAGWKGIFILQVRLSSANRCKWKWKGYRKCRQHLRYFPCPRPRAGVCSKGQIHSAGWREGKNKKTAFPCFGWSVTFSEGISGCECQQHSRCKLPIKVSVHFSEL